ncbi:MAG: zinc ribbon domain-containing protein [Clostridiales bacterium]|nr:zinc ribbon domain-containing protein [Clostridiales bacterium]
MFLIFGIDTVRKEIPYDKLIICSKCGRYGRYNVYMLCKCFSLFFIPIIKWDRHYYVESICCGALYELNQEVGNRLRSGENIEISDRDLIYIGNNNEWTYSKNTYSKRCINCGYIAQADFEYCPKCGHKLGD